MLKWTFLGSRGDPEPGIFFTSIKRKARFSRRTRRFRTRSERVAPGGTNTKRRTPTGGLSEKVVSDWKIARRSERTRNKAPKIQSGPERSTDKRLPGRQAAKWNVRDGQYILRILYGYQIDRCAHRRAGTTGSLCMILLFGRRAGTGPLCTILLFG